MKSEKKKNRKLFRTRQRQCHEQTLKEATSTMQGRRSDENVTNKHIRERGSSDDTQYNRKELLLEAFHTWKLRIKFSV